MNTEIGFKLGACIGKDFHVAVHDEDKGWVKLLRILVEIEIRYTLGQRKNVIFRWEIDFHFFHF